MPVSTARAALLKKRLDRFTKTLPGVEQGDVSCAPPGARRLAASSRASADAPASNTRQPSTSSASGCARSPSVWASSASSTCWSHLLDELHLSRRERSRAVGRVGMVGREGNATRRASALPRELPVDEMRAAGAQAGCIVVADLRRRRGAPSRRIADRSWRWAIDARVARRATHLLSSIDDAGAVYMPERLHARPHRDEEAALRGGTAGRRRRRRAGAELRLLTAPGQELLGQHARPRRAARARPAACRRR